MWFATWAQDPEHIERWFGKHLPLPISQLTYLQVNVLYMLKYEKIASGNFSSPQPLTLVPTAA